MLFDDALCGRINAIFVPKGGISLRKRQYHIIKWEQIEQIGGDMILVRLPKNAEKK